MKLRIIKSLPKNRLNNISNLWIDLKIITKNYQSINFTLNITVLNQIQANIKLLSIIFQHVIEIKFYNLKKMTQFGEILNSKNSLKNKCSKFIKISLCLKSRKKKYKKIIKKKRNYNMNFKNLIEPNFRTKYFHLA